MITGRRPAAAPAPSPGWATWAGVDEFLQSTETETEAEAGADEVAVHEWWAREPSSPGEAGQAGAGADGSLAGDALLVRTDGTGVEDLDGPWCPAEAFAAYPTHHEDSVAFSPLEGRRPPGTNPDNDGGDGGALLDHLIFDEQQELFTARCALSDTTATIDQVLRGADPRQERAERSGSTAPAGPDHVPVPDQSSAGTGQSGAAANVIAGPRPAASGPRQVTACSVRMSRRP